MEPLSHAHRTTDSSQPSRVGLYSVPCRPDTGLLDLMGSRITWDRLEKLQLLLQDRKPKVQGRVSLSGEGPMALATGFPGAEDAQHHLNEAGGHCLLRGEGQRLLNREKSKCLQRPKPERNLCSNLRKAAR